MVGFKRLKSGVEGIDALIGGGFPEGSVVLVAGTPGTGKTILGIQYLVEGTKKKEMGILISFEQEKSDIIRQAACFGWDLEAMEKKNLLRVVSMWPTSFDEVMTKIFKCLYFKPKRLVVDSVTSVTYSMKENREAFHKMTEKLKKTGLTAMLTSELLAKQKGYSRDGVSEFVSDGLIVLRSREAAGEHKNLLRVEKMRSSKINKESHLYEITDKGFQLTAPPAGI